MSQKKKKGPKQETAKRIIALRDKLIAAGNDPEKVGLACKGMYRCDKEVDAACLNRILASLEAMQAGDKKPKKKGGAARSKSRSRSRSRSKSR